MELSNEEVVTTMDAHQLKIICEAAIRAGATNVSINRGTYYAAKTDAEYGNHPGFIKATALDSWSTDERILLPVSANIDVLNKSVEVVAITRDEFVKYYKEHSSNNSMGVALQESTDNSDNDIDAPF